MLCAWSSVGGLPCAPFWPRYILYVMFGYLVGGAFRSMRCSAHARVLGTDERGSIPAASLDMRAQLSG